MILQLKFLTKRYAVLFLTLLLIASTRAGSGLIDGTTWTVQTIPTVETAEKGAERFDDLLTFSGGKLSSRELGRSGIGPVSYTAEGTKDFLNWRTAPMLRGKKKAEWDGTIKEKTIKGTLKWVTEDGRTRYYFINGSRK